MTKSKAEGWAAATLTSTIPLIKDGEIAGAVEIYRDLTQIKELSDKVLNLQSVLFKKKTKEKVIQGNGAVHTFADIIGENTAIRNLIQQTRKVADSSSPVLVYGETGTGKELLVQAIHNAGTSRRYKPPQYGARQHFVWDNSRQFYRCQG